RDRYADTTGIDGCKSPDMRIEFAQLGLIARDGYSPDFLESQLGARIHKSWIQMLSAGIDLLIVGRYLCIFPDKFNHFSINKYDPVVNDTIRDRMNRHICNCKFAEFSLFCYLGLSRSHAQYDPQRPCDNRFPVPHYHY